MKLLFFYCLCIVHIYCVPGNFDSLYNISSRFQQLPVILSVADSILGDISDVSSVVSALKPGDVQIADKVLTPIQHIVDLGGFNFLGSVGKAVYNLIDGHYKKEIDDLDQLKKIEQSVENSLQTITTQITYFEQEIEDDFQQILSTVTKDTYQLSAGMKQDMIKVITSIQQTSCYQEFNSHAQILVQANQILQKYYKYRNDTTAEYFKKEFMYLCGNYKCELAIQWMLHALAGTEMLTQCDVLKLIYQGDAIGEFYMGWQDHMTARSAYLFAQVMQGVVSLSVHHYISNNSTNEEGVEDLLNKQYNDTIFKIASRIQQYNLKCKNETLQNVQINAQRIVAVQALESVHQQVSSINNMLKKVFPYNRYVTILFVQNEDGKSDYYAQCHNCVYVQNYYGFVFAIGQLPLNSAGSDDNYHTQLQVIVNSVTTSAPGIARSIYDRVQRQGCYLGIVVTQRIEQFYKGATFDSNSFMEQYWGYQYMLVVWGISNMDNCL